MFNGLNGIYIELASNGQLINNTAFNNTGSSSPLTSNGIYLYNTQNHELINNTVYNNTNFISADSSSGILLLLSDNNNLTGNLAYENAGTQDRSGYGIYLRSSDNNNLINNEWHTEASGTTNNNGVLEYTGFYGDYNLTIPLLGNTYHINAKKEENNEFLVMLN